MYLVDGEARDTLSLQDRGLHYGDGLFETVAVIDGRMPLWERHMARLCRDAPRLGLPPPDPALLAAEARRLCAGTARGVLKIILTRGPGRGYAPPPQARPTRILCRYPWPAYPESHRREGVRVRVCRMRLGENPRLAGIKHLNRLEQVLARSEWRDPDIAEGLLLDQQGRVIEGTQSNVFAVRKGCLLTPDLSRCGVAGVMRAWILEEARSAGIPCEVRDLPLEELLAAEEVFLCNSVAGIWPVRRIEETAYPPPRLAHVLQQRLHRSLAAPVV